MSKFIIFSLLVLFSKNSYAYDHCKPEILDNRNWKGERKQCLKKCMEKICYNIDFDPDECKENCLKIKK